MNLYLSAWEKSFTTQGRARRREFFLFSLVNFLILSVLEFIIKGIIPVSGLYPVMVGLYVIFAIAFIVSSGALSIRRLHDIGRSGWWVLIAFVPVLGLVLFVFMFLDSQPNVNDYGSSPKHTE